MTNTDERDPLGKALRAVAQEDAAAGVSPVVEARLLAEVRLIRLAQRRPSLHETARVARNAISELCDASRANA